MQEHARGPSAAPPSAETLRVDSPDFWIRAVRNGTATGWLDRLWPCFRQSRAFAQQVLAAEKAARQTAREQRNEEMAKLAKETPRRQTIRRIQRMPEEERAQVVANAERELATRAATRTRNVALGALGVRRARESHGSRTRRSPAARRASGRRSGADPGSDDGPSEGPGAAGAALPGSTRRHHPAPTHNGDGPSRRVARAARHIGRAPRPLTAAGFNQALLEVAPFHAGPFALSVFEALPATIQDEFWDSVADEAKARCQR